MASRRYICTNGYRWMISLLLSLTACFVHVYGFSQCYNEAEKASIPAALMCYNNHVVGPRVVLDVSRAKESNRTDCVCTVTSETPTKFNFSNYNNYHSGSGCGSALMFSANGHFHPQQCYVNDMQLPSSNLTVTSVDISIIGPKSAPSTDYCVLIESDVVFTLNCSGDLILSSITQSTLSTTTTSTLLTSTSTSSTTSKQSTITTTSMSSTTSTPSKASAATMPLTQVFSTTTMSSTEVFSTATKSSVEVLSTYNPTITTVQSHDQSTVTTSTAWRYMVPVIVGVGGLLLAIIIAVFYNRRLRTSSHACWNTKGVSRCKHSRPGAGVL